MQTLLYLIENYGLWFVFVAVLVDQGGVPLPAYPAIILASAIAAGTATPLWPIVLVATLAALCADLLWYVGGWYFGGQLIRLMCRVSLSPDSCVTTTRGVYARWGAPSLIVAKFVPGFAAVVTTLAGQARTRAIRFAFYDSIGALLWAGVAVVLGATFHTAVKEVLAQLELWGHVGVLLLLGVIAIFVVWKAWRRHRFVRLIRMARISVLELKQLLADGEAPLLLDVRPRVLREASGWIPGALQVSRVDQLEAGPRAEVVVYCDCPNEASAALLARELKQRGFAHVRPLEGGFAAWQAHGLPIEYAVAA